MPHKVSGGKGLTTDGTDRHGLKTFARSTQRPQSFVGSGDALVPVGTRDTPVPQLGLLTAQPSKRRTAFSTTHVFFAVMKEIQNPWSSVANSPRSQRPPRDQIVKVVSRRTICFDRQYGNSDIRGIRKNVRHVRITRQQLNDRVRVEKIAITIHHAISVVPYIHAACAQLSRTGFSEPGGDCERYEGC